VVCFPVSVFSSEWVHTLERPSRRKLSTWLTDSGLDEMLFQRSSCKVELYFLRWGEGMALWSECEYIEKAIAVLLDR
jgi:hypothetical protein